jgi:formate/nitrite transporter FocA (FNT family)
MSDQVRDSPLLHGAEKDQAEDHAPLPRLVIHEIVRAEGEAELKKAIPVLFWSGLAAGLSMGFSYVAQALLQADLPPGPGQHALASAGYAVGFAIVILGRQQLFTESTLTAVLPALHDRDPRTWVSTVRLWAVVLLANLLGTWLFAAVLAFGQPLPEDAGPALVRLADEATAHPFWNTFLRSILAGWLIALMVWLLPSARTARILIIALLTWLVAFARLSHVIAGSTEVAYAVLIGRNDLGAYAMTFLLPTLLGNTIGGVCLVALLNHAPVSADTDDSEAE